MGWTRKCALQGRVEGSKRTACGVSGYGGGAARCGVVFWVGVLLDGDVAVDVLGSCEGIEEDVGQHGHHEPVGAHVAHSTSDGVLDEGHDAERLKMVPHMSEVQRPQRTRKRALMGTWNIWNPSPTL